MHRFYQTPAGASVWIDARVLLEYGLDELSDMAAQAFAAANSAGEHILLPVEDIIRAGLTAWGQGWPALALERAAEFAGIAALEPEISALAETGKPRPSGIAHSNCVRV